MYQKCDRTTGEETDIMLFTISSHIDLLCSLCSLSALFENQEAWSVCSVADLNRFNTQESSCI